MIYEVRHLTRYEYEEPVSLSNHVARLAPSAMEGQEVLSHELSIRPAPFTRHEFSDYFGNSVTFFAMKGLHEVLEIEAFSRIQVADKVVPNRESGVPWRVVCERVKSEQLNEETQAGEFIYASPVVKWNPSFEAYASQFFKGEVSVLEASESLTTSMFQEFKFDATATDVATPVDVAFKQRRGVCQDFAHIFLACARSVGVPARYVSGYLETLPPPGQAKLVGADASHAWVEVWCGAELGWVQFDPTNGCLPGKRHIAIAKGRDFFDVSPLKGVVYGYGSQNLTVQVDVNAMLDSCLNKELVESFSK